LYHKLLQIIRPFEVRTKYNKNKYYYANTILDFIRCYFITYYIDIGCVHLYDNVSCYILFILSLSHFIYICKSVDKIAFAICGSQCGYVINNPNVFNPINYIFVFLSKVSRRRYIISMLQLYVNIDISLGLHFYGVSHCLLLFGNNVRRHCYWYTFSVVNVVSNSKRSNCTPGATCFGCSFNLESARFELHHDDDCRTRLCTFWKPSIRKLINLIY
jgi:hypothetical protein